MLQNYIWLPTSFRSIFEVFYSNRLGQNQMLHEQGRELKFADRSVCIKRCVLRFIEPVLKLQDHIFPTLDGSGTLIKMTASGLTGCNLATFVPGIASSRASLIATLLFWPRPGAWVRLHFKKERSPPLFSPSYPFLSYLIVSLPR